MKATRPKNSKEQSEQVNNNDIIINYSSYEETCSKMDENYI